MEKHNIQNNIGYYSYCLSQKMKKNVEKRIKKYDLNSQEFSILLQVSTFSKLSQKEIGNKLTVDDPTTAKLIKKLLDKKLITRLSNSEDKRIKLISLSQEGKYILDKLILEAKEEEDKIKANMDEAEFNMLIFLLKKANTDYELL